MARSKVKYEFVADGRARKETLRKRKAGVIKKASELKSLCGIDACAIIYDNEGDLPVVWPSTLEAQRVLKKFESSTSLIPTRTMLDQEDFLMQNVIKLKKKVEKEEKKNRQREIELCILKCLSENNSPNVINLEDRKDLHLAVENVIKLINKKIEEGSQKGKEKQFI